MNHNLLSFLFVVTAMMSHVSLLAKVDPPKPVLPVPTAEQVAWQRMETYAFIHYGPDTFYGEDGVEWGYGNYPVDLFNPTLGYCDVDQWVDALQAGGMKGVIFTAKHHDGFCLWPTEYTDYSIKNSPYKQGKGDVVGELAEACRKKGMKFGIYLSPWDRHQATYATPAYVDYYKKQLREVLSNYGELFEVWFDGANGGDGWYGGADEKRSIDKEHYYDFPTLFGYVRELQPQAIIFSNGGPGCRWVGSEEGVAGATCWSMLRSADARPAFDASYSMNGAEDGDVWVPAECDVSIRRPNWFYHEADNAKGILTADQLEDLYNKNVGHNATFLLNVPVTRTGRMHPTDVANLKAFREKLDRIYAHNLLVGSKVKGSHVRSSAYKAKNVLSDDYDSYWATPDGVCSASLTFKFCRKAQSFNRIVLQEYIPLGQRVKKFEVEYSLDGKSWTGIDCGEETTTIGYKRILVFPTVMARMLRVRFLDARGPLCINNIGAYLAE